MQDGDWRDEEDAVESFVETNVNVQLVEGDVLAFSRNSRLDELRSDMCLNNVALSQVPHPPHQAQFPIAHSDDGVMREQ